LLLQVLVKTNETRCKFEEKIAKNTCQTNAASI